MRYSTTFPTTVGIEYTFVPQIKTKMSEATRLLVGEYAARALQVTAGLHMRTRLKIHSQNGAIEVPSPIHSDREKMRAFARKVFDSAETQFLTPRFVVNHKNGDSTYLGTGGGHVHVGIPKELTRKERKLFFHNVAADSFNRPELIWFFQEWHDDEALPDRILRPHPYRCLRKLWGEGTERVIRAPMRCREVPIVIRTREANYPDKVWDRNTLEFRIFDAPRNVWMVERNVDFALAYTMYLKDLTKSGVKLRVRKNEVLNRRRWTPAQVREKLEKLFRKLGLRYEDYHYTYFPNYEMAPRPRKTLTMTIERHIDLKISIRLEDLRGVWANVTDVQRMEILKSVIWTAPDTHAFYTKAIIALTSDQFKETLD